MKFLPFAIRPAPAQVPLPDEAEALVGSVDLERGRNVQRLLNYHDALRKDHERLRSEIARTVMAAEAVAAAIRREQAALPIDGDASEEVIEAALADLGDALLVDLPIAAE